MAEPLVSVVLPVYNAARTLPEAIESILPQTADDFELIAVDDGSTDNSLAILERYARDDARVCVTGRPHEGIVSALCAGCGQARGTFVARMDADDIAEPTRLERQLQAFEGDPNLALCGTQVAMVGSVGEGRSRYADWLNNLTTHEAIYRERFIECGIAHPAFMMRRACYEQVGGYRDAPWAEDYDLFLRIAEAGGRFTNVDAPLMRWRESTERLSMNDPRYSLDAFRACKIHYLQRSVLADGVEFYQWGAGQVGKAWLRAWDGPGPVAVVDVNPRKIGKTIHDTPVIRPDELPPSGTALTLVAVGAPGAREDIRQWFDARGYDEERDFLFVA